MQNLKIVYGMAHVMCVRIGRVSGFYEYANVIKVEGK
jgi:hypothetical protein